MTLTEMYNKIKNDLAGSGVESSSFESHQLMEHFCFASKHDLIVNGDRKLDPFCEEQVIDALKRRISHEPLQYIIGKWEFFGREFAVGEGVLIPRQDTETIVETAIHALNGIDNPVVADLCSGSGCIGITIAKEIKNSKVYAVELSQKAIYYLKQNAENLHAENLTVVSHDVNEYTPCKLLDMVVSNPPYISPSEMITLQPELKFEPEMALFAKDDGLYFYKSISKRYKDYLKEGGIILFEIGYTQSSSVENILEECGYKQIRTIKDLCGLDRAVIAQK